MGFAVKMHLQASATQMGAFSLEMKIGQQTRQDPGQTPTGAASEGLLWGTVLSCGSLPVGLAAPSRGAHTLTLFAWIRWKFFPCTRKPCSKFRHSSSPQAQRPSAQGQWAQQG